MDASDTYLNVTAPPFNAVGDGETDDSAAIQRAVDAAQAATWPRLSETRSSSPPRRTRPRGNDGATKQPDERS